MKPNLPLNSLASRLFIMLSLNTLLIIGMAAYSIYTMVEADDRESMVFNEITAPASHLSDSYRQALMRHIQLMETLTLNGEEKIKRMKVVDLFHAQSTESFEKLTSSTIHPELKSLVDNYIQMYPIATGQYEKLRALANNGDHQAVTRYIESELRPLGVKIATNVRDVNDALHKVSSTLHDNGEASHKVAEKIMGIVAIVGVIVTSLLSFNAIRLLRHSLCRASSLSELISEGHLGRPINTEGPQEISKVLGSLNQMNTRLKKVVEKVRGSVTSVQSAATQMYSSNEDLAARTESQASNLEHASSALKSMTGTVKENAVQAKKASELARQTQDHATEGEEVVVRTVAAMKDINNASDSIVDIVTMIDDIAFQTNLLALNAAVEAARAGEQGRGFAVVATEVRNLAQRSAEAAQDVKKLISDSAEKVETGTNLVDESGKVLGEILQSVVQVASIIDGISDASHHQAKGIDSINRSIEEVDSATQANSALVEEAAVASRELHNLAVRLQDDIAFFQIDGVKPSTSRAANNGNTHTGLKPAWEH